VSDFEKENKYLVVKRSDLRGALIAATPEMQSKIDSSLEYISKVREISNKPELCCVVVEHDWPMYADTWKSIQQYVETGSYIEQDEAVRKAKIEVLDEAVSEIEEWKSTKDDVESKKYNRAMNDSIGIINNLKSQIGGEK